MNTEPFQARKTSILGVSISNLSKNEINEQLKSFLAGKNFHHITTPNPEIVLKAGKDKELCHILNTSDLALPDGTGLLFASSLIGSPLPGRYTGRELILSLARISEQKNYSIYFLGGRGETAQKAAEKIQKKFPRLRIAGAEEGIPDSKNPPSVQEEERLIERINNSKADILFVAFGAPFQEKWIARNQKKYKHVKIAAGIGGMLNYISGQSPTPPTLLQNMGLEWLWRLITEPWRFVRIIKATIVFPFKVIIFHFFRRTKNYETKQ